MTLRYATSGFAFGMTFFLFSNISQAGLPTVECKDLWWKNKLTKGEYLYSFDLHKNKTERGNEGYAPFYESILRQSCFKEWAVFIYMNADNDLTLASYTDIDEMENIGSAVSVDVIVYHDSNENTGSRYLHIAKDPEVKKGTIRKNRKRPRDFVDFHDLDILSPIAKWLPETDSANVETFQNFLEWGLKHYPSKHVAIIVWSHGMGWGATVGDEYDFTTPSSGSRTTENIYDPLKVLRHLSNLSKAPPAGAPPAAGGISFDGASDDHSITIPQLRKSLTNLRMEYRDGKPFDVLGSDACLMQMLEVAFELKDEARFIIGSQATQTNLGWPYTTILRELIHHPLGQKTNETFGEGIDAAYQWAKKIPKLYQKSYSGDSNSSQGKNPKAVMTTVNSAELSLAFPHVLNDFGDALMNFTQSNEGLRVDQLRSLIGKTFSFSGLSQDLYHFTLLINEWLKEGRRAPSPPSPPSYNELRKATESLENWLTRITLSRGVSQYYDEVEKTGAAKTVSIWLPASNEEFRKHFVEFKRSRLYRDSSSPTNLGGWARFNEYVHK